MDEIPEIKFIAGYDELNVSVAKLYPPYPAAKQLPEWYKDLPSIYESKDIPGGPTKSAKTCPGIFDMLRSGYIIPAWSDMAWQYNPDEDYPENMKEAYPKIISSNDHLRVRYHEAQQIQGCPMNHGQNRPHNKFVKLHSPWYIESPEDISIMYIHPYFRRSTDYTVMPGIIDPWIDKISNKEVNIFIELHSPNTEIWIKAGDPLVQVIPFRRENYRLNIDTTKEDAERFQLLQIKQSLKLPVVTDNEKKLQRNRGTKNKNYDA